MTDFALGTILGVCITSAIVCSVMLVADLWFERYVCARLTKRHLNGKGEREPRSDLLRVPAHAARGPACALHPRAAVAWGWVVSACPKIPSTPAGRLAFVSDLLGGEYEYVDEETGEPIRGYAPPMITEEQARELLDLPDIESAPC